MIASLHIAWVRAAFALFPIYGPLTALATAQLPLVPPVDFSKLEPTEFADDELDLPYFLAHLHRVANSIVSEGPERGFIDIVVWRKGRDNRPYNARIMENHLALAAPFCVTHEEREQRRRQARADLNVNWPAVAPLKAFEPYHLTDQQHVAALSSVLFNVPNDGGWHQYAAMLGANGPHWTRRSLESSRSTPTAKRATSARTTAEGLARKTGSTQITKNSLKRSGIRERTDRPSCCSLSACLHRIDSVGWCSRSCSQSDRMDGTSIL